MAPPAASAAEEPTPDEALFLQAESFYQYRFSLRPPTAKTYAAQAAAALVEFSPLNALAASGGINDLRLASYNGAAQLYETLLSRFPATKLRPLALWRLGWAYRNVNIGGYPRTAEQAHDELVRDYPGSHFADLAAEARRIPYKTQNAAIAWSILPGAGQMYAGEWGNGTLRMIIAAAFAAAAVIPIVIQVQDRDFDWRLTAVSLVGIVGIQVTYTAAYQDAQRAALEYNERQEAAFRRTHPDSP